MSGKEKKRAIYSRWARIRMLMFGVVAMALMGCVLKRGHYLHTVKGPRLREMAQRQHKGKIFLTPKRGNIVDRHGTPLAVSVDVPSIAADPLLVGKHAAAAARRLAPLLGKDPRKLARKLSSKRRFIWLKRRIHPQLARRIMALKLPGIRLEMEPRRFYPNNGLGATVVGFSGTGGKGLEGIELSMEKYLKGKPVELTGYRDARRRAILTEGPRPNTTQGNTVVLSLDPYIQHEAEQAIAEAAKTVRPKTGWVGAVVLDPATGDVLAMANAPSYNPNRYAKYPIKRWRNRTVTDTFEPGSTAKPFSVGAALQAGKVKATESIHCENGAWRVGRHTIHDSHGYGLLDVTGIIKKSSNIGTAKIAFRLGKVGLHQGLRRFGFGRRTGVGVRGERAGVLRSPKRWSKVGLANIAFGQGMTATIIQLAQALTAVANDGMLMTPRLTLEVRNPKGETVKEFPSEGRRVLSPEVARTMRRMMATVTEKGGTGTNAAMDRHTVAGKTGTAQKVDPILRAYSSELWVSSFIGFVPAIQPRLIIAVVVNEPGGKKHYGGEVAAPVFKRIAERALGYLSVTPDKAASKKKKKMAKKETAAEKAKRKKIAANVRPPAPPLPGKARARTFRSVEVPDFTGMSIVEVLETARKLGLRVEPNGSGTAVAQSPGPGPAAQPTLLRVSFRPPG